MHEFIWPEGLVKDLSIKLWRAEGTGNILYSFILHALPLQLDPVLFWGMQKIVKGELALTYRGMKSFLSETDKERDLESGQAAKWENRPCFKGAELDYSYIKHLISVYE